MSADPMGDPPEATKPAAPTRGTTAGRANGARFRFSSPVDVRGYARLDAVFEDTDLEIALRYTYFIVKQHAWTNQESALTTDEIGRLLGRSPAQAYRYLQELVEAGLLSIASRPFDGQPDIYCLEPLESRYGPGVQADAPGQLTLTKTRGLRGRQTTSENRGAVIPVTTDERRAYEARLAARIPSLAPVRKIDPHLREVGLDRARTLRQQLGSPEGTHAD